MSFVYSHFAQINEDGSRCDDRFNEAMGWRYEEVVVDGVALLGCMAFEPYPSNVGYIWYAPNHLRAFRASDYEKVGGYSPQLDVLDDQDLMSLLYLEGDFALIDECLYLQRVHGRNTQSNPKLNNRIQVETVHLYDHYIESLSLAWAERQGLHALDLGAAHNKPAGYLGVDLYEGEGVDIVADVAKGIDLPDGSVGVIRAVDFLEHIPDKVALFNELYRLLAHGGMLLTHTPSSDGRGAYQDPTHCAFYNENSFWYFTDADFARFVPSIECRFQVSRTRHLLPERVARAAPDQLRDGQPDRRQGRAADRGRTQDLRSSAATGAVAIARRRARRAMTKAAHSPASPTTKKLGVPAEAL